MKAFLVLLLRWPLLASTSTVENIELFTSATGPYNSYDELQSN